VDDLVSCMCLIGSFRMESGDFNVARQSFLQAFNVLNMHVNEVNPELSHRVYANLAGMSRSTSDMSHWVDNAHLLGREAGTPINRVYLSLLYCSPSMLRDPKNKPLPLNLYIPQEQRLPQNDLVLYQRMLVEFDEAEEIISLEESKINVIGDYITSFKMIVYGCRSLVLAQFGCREQAIICAEKCIKYAQSLKQTAIYFAMALGLAYALQVCKSLNRTHLLNEGIPIMESYRPFYPIVTEILNILNLDLNTSPFPNIKEQMPIEVKKDNSQVFYNENVNQNPHPIFQNVNNIPHFEGEYSI